MSCVKLMTWPCILHVLVYLYGFFFLIMFAGKLEDILDWCLKKPVPIEISIPVTFLNMVIAALYIFHFSPENGAMSNSNIFALRAHRQFFVICAVFQIVFHIEYANSILLYIILYLYANIWLYLSDVLLATELSHQNDIESQSVDRQVDCERQSVANNTV